MSANVNGRLNMKHVSAKFVLQLLTEDQKNNRLNICYYSREQAGNDPQILSKVVNGNETWCYGYDLETKKHQANGKLLILQKAKKARQV